MKGTADISFWSSATHTHNMSLFNSVPDDPFPQIPSSTDKLRELPIFKWKSMGFSWRQPTRSWLFNHRQSVPPYVCNPTHESNDSQDSLTRDDQERRAILRFGAFLVLRRPSLRRMISPADSGPKFEVGESRESVRFILDKGSTINRQFHRPTGGTASPDKYSTHSRWRFINR